VASPVNLYVTICIWVLLGGVTAYLAHRRGRGPLPWFLVGLVLGVLAIALLYLWPTAQQTAQHREALAGNPQKQPQPAQPAITTTAVAVEEPVDVIWHYLDGEDEQHGPVSIRELEKLWDERVINLESYVWSQGMPEWQTIGDLPALRDRLQTL
jgi:hypothetical protein